jgi:hypothetical protein
VGPSASTTGSCVVPSIAQAMDFSYVGISDYMPLIGTQ